MSKRVERIFWIITAVALGVYLGSLVEMWGYQAYLDRQFAQELKAPPHTAPKGFPANVAAGRIKPAEGQPLARLEIPAIHLSAIVAEGVDDRTLRRTIGHIPGTALPGRAGNVGLSAHRDTFFRHLGKLRQGDLISITTLAGKLDYVVESTSIVSPDDSAALRNLGRPTMTLVTCYPFYYIGFAPKRFVVQARLRT